MIMVIVGNGHDIRLRRCLTQFFTTRLPRSIFQRVWQKLEPVTKRNARINQNANVWRLNVGAHRPNAETLECEWFDFNAPHRLLLLSWHKVQHGKADLYLFIPAALYRNQRAMTSLAQLILE
jgi:hypothetical protein